MSSPSSNALLAQGLVLIVLGSVFALGGWVYSSYIRQSWPSVVAVGPSGLMIYFGLLRIRASQELKQRTRKPTQQ